MGTPFTSIGFNVCHRKASGVMLLAVALMGNLLAAEIPPGVALHPTQTLIRNNGSEPDSIDPMLTEIVPGINITLDLFEGLTAYDGAGKLVPGVALTWKQTNPTTWIFNLRRDAKWSNGDGVTADDFIYGMRRLVDPKTASGYANTFGVFLLNGKEITEGKKAPTELGVKAIDKYTVEVKTPFPVGFLADLMANPQLGPAHKATVEKFGKEWTKPGNMVSNGAFTLRGWQVNSKIVLVKNPQYWDAKNVQITKVTYLPIEGAVSDVKLFESGENDWVDALPPGTYEKYKSQYPKEIRLTPLLGISYYAFLNSDPLLKDVRVRKALSMVVDRELLSQRVLANGQIPAYGLIVRGTNGADVIAYEWASWPMEKRVADARKLLMDAGVAPGTKIKFAYNTGEANKNVAIFVASEWKSKLGLDLELEAMEFKVLVKKRTDKNYQIARHMWVADYNDATTFLSLVQCGNDQNVQDSCTKAADALIDKGNQNLDPGKRKALLTEAAKLAMDDYPLMPLWQSMTPRLIRTYVGGYTATNFLDRYRGKDLYIIKH
jgi:oligopeptide transport system substrate-binding protein